jgi:AcrR family transcriptional regulator
VATALTPRQREILRVARDLLERDSVEALTLGAVAKTLGIKTPSLYKHFAGKAELEAALMAQGLDEFASALEAAEPDLVAIGGAYRAYALAHPQLYRLMSERPLPRDLLPGDLEARAALPIQRALRDPHLARAAWAFAHGMVSLEIAGRFPPWSKLDKSWARALEALEAARHSAETPAA